MKVDTKVPFSGYCMSPDKTVIHKLVSAACCCAIIAAMSLVLALACSGILLVDSQEPQHADVIVVLGGENKTRSAKARDLYQNGFAQKILLSGAVDAYLLRKKMIAEGIPESSFILEPDSETTFENGEFSSKLLQNANVDSVLLVTSWFHSRRAAAVFRRHLPNVRIISTPTETVSLRRVAANKWILRQVLQEYAKSAVYVLRYGLMLL